MADDKTKTQPEEVLEKTAEVTAEASNEVSTETSSEETQPEVSTDTAEETKKPAKKAKAENPNLKWYVVNSHSGHEKKVAKLIEQRIDASGLEDKVTEVLVPTRNVVTVKDGHQKIKEEQIFPGYVMVRMVMDEQTWYIIRNTEGVTGFVGTDGKPKPISEEEVSSIKKFVSIEQPEFKASFKMGDAVKIKQGAFADFMGTVSGINEQKGQVTVLISIFGRETPVDLDFTDVIKL